MSTERKVLAGFSAVVYLLSVVVANWATTRYGFVSVGFGHAATAGTFAAGGALVVRDVLQDAIGRIGVAALIVAGAGLSFAVAAPAIAVASMLAFLLAESIDMAIYTPLRRKGAFGGRWWQVAVGAGALVGAVADSVVFLWVAFGRAAIASSLTGQLLGKYEVALAFIVIGAVGRALLREPVYAESA